MIQMFVHNYTMSVMQEATELADFVRKTMEDKGLTAREIERRSKQGGKQGITHSYVNKIKNGDSKNPSPHLLQALAKGLGETDEIIFALIRRKTIDFTKVAHERFGKIAEEYSALNSQDKKNIEPVLSALEQAIRSTPSFLKKIKTAEFIDDSQTEFFEEFEEDAEIQNGIAEIDNYLEEHNQKVRQGKIKVPEIKTNLPDEDEATLELKDGKIVPLEKAIQKKKPSGKKA